MNVKIKIANTKAQRLYLLGVVSGHGSFPPASAKERQVLQKRLGRRTPQKLPSSYDTFIALKESLLFQRIEFREIVRGTEAVLTPKAISIFSEQKALRLQKSLRILFIRHAERIDSFFRAQGISMRPLTVFILPGFGERGEALSKSVVIGDTMNSSVAMAIALEELLHIGVHSWQKRHTILNRLQISDEKLADEALVGALLCMLLRELKYSKKLVDSVVFGWHGGERRRFVEKIITKQYI